ncbi:MAG: CsgG/HfaB family protein [Thermoanaerobaculia bacterium]
MIFASLPQRAFAQKPLSEALEDLAAKISASMGEEQKRRVAVLPARMNGGSTNALCTYVAEELLSDLVNLKKVQVVERGMLDQLLKEIDLDHSAAIDPATAQKAKKISGAEALVLSVITDFPSYVAMNSRMIDTETGSIFAAAQVKLLRDENVKQLLASGRQVADPGASAASNGEAGNSPESKPAPMVKVVENFRFELTGCWASGAEVECPFIVTNLGADRFLSVIGSRSFDEAGDEFQGSSCWLGSSQSEYSVSKSLLTNIAVKAGVAFKGIPASTSSLTALELIISPGNSATFRNVPIQR